MLNIEIDVPNAIATLSPDSSLSEADFKRVTAVIDPFIEQHGKLNGLIISVESFPGWDSFGGLLSHLTFVKNHHKEIKNIALVTDSSLSSFAEDIASHFISAKVKAFKYHDFDLAKTWIVSNNDE